MSFDVKALKEMGHEVYFLAMYKSNSESYEDVEPSILKGSPINFIIDIFNPGKKKELHRWPCFFHLAWKLFKIKPDLLLVKNLQGGLSFLSFVLGRFFAKRTVAMVQTEKHFISHPAKKIFKFVLKNFLNVQAIMTPLKNVSEKSDSWFVYQPFIIKADDFEKSYFADGNINIIDIGKFQQRKGHLVLLEAVRGLCKKYPIKLTIIGELYDEKVLSGIKNYIKENALTGIVEIKENLPHNEVLAMYRKYDLFVLPAEKEPAAYSLVEAMAAKLPIIASTTCGTSCYIENGENGYIFKSGQAEDLADKIEKIIKDKDVLMAMSLKSFGMASTEHSLERFKKTIAEFLK
jgi:glycosyltransferase involved in cell wall biosynthesis